MPYIAQFEKAGIPTVLIVFEDQLECLKQGALVFGIPNIRTVFTSRTLMGPEDADRIMKPLMEALTRPLTDKEKESGRWEVPDKRVLFEGTLDEAEEFYQQTQKYPMLQNAPISLYGDGLAIRVPTEERVREMLKGTSHKPDEVIALQSDHTEPVSRMVEAKRKKGEVVRFPMMDRTATVEKVAINAVMAGCRPEYLPVVLAIAEAGGGCHDGRGGDRYCVSGPIAREIGMNFDVNILGPGNPANRSIGRAAELMWRNFGGNIPAVTNCGTMGNALFNCFPENLDALPPGWKGLNEEYGFKRDENVVYLIVSGGGQSSIQGTQFSMGGYRAFQKSGHGGIARRLGVKGVPGPKNWLEYMIPDVWASTEGGITFIMLPQMAQHLYECGFKSKDEVYEWIYKKSFMTVAQYRTHSWPDMRTNAWLGIERTSGKPWKELPDDYMVPVMNDPRENCIIVTGGGEEKSMWFEGRNAGQELAYSIDNWR